MEEADRKHVKVVAQVGQHPRAAGQRYAAHKGKVHIILGALLQGSAGKKGGENTFPTSMYGDETQEAGSCSSCNPDERSVGKGKLTSRCRFKEARHSSRLATVWLKVQEECADMDHAMCRSIHLCASQQNGLLAAKDVGRRLRVEASDGVVPAHTSACAPSQAAGA